MSSDSNRILRTPIPKETILVDEVYEIIDQVVDFENPRLSDTFFVFDLVVDVAGFGDEPFTDQAVIDRTERRRAGRKHSDRELQEGKRLSMLFEERAARVGRILSDEEERACHQLHDRHMGRRFLIDLLLLGRIVLAGEDAQGNVLYRRGAAS